MKEKKSLKSRMGTMQTDSFAGSHQQKTQKNTRIVKTVPTIRKCARCGRGRADCDFYRYDKTCKRCRIECVKLKYRKNPRPFIEYAKRRYWQDPRRFIAYAIQRQRRLKARLPLGQREFSIVNLQ